MVWLLKGLHKGSKPQRRTKNIKYF